MIGLSSMWMGALSGPTGGGTGPTVPITNYDFYVGGPGALDTNSGSYDFPFATPQKAASVATAGKKVGFRTGIYRSDITPTNSGAINNEVLYEGIPGETVIFSGLNTVPDGSWTLHSGNIWKQTITLPLATNYKPTNECSNFKQLGVTELLANQVFCRGEMMMHASWPKGRKTQEDLFKMTAAGVATPGTNDGWRYKNYLGGSLVLGHTQIVDQALTAFASGSLTGALVISQGWYVRNSAVVSAHSGTTLNLTVDYLRYTGPGAFWKYYFLTNQLQFLTQEREWHYQSGVLYLWQPGGGSPTGVEYKARNHAFNLNGKSYIKISNIKFIGCEPVTGNSTTNNCTLDGIKCSFQNHSFRHQLFVEQGHGQGSMMGIKMVGTGNKIRNSEFSWSANMSIWASAGTEVFNCKWDRIGYDGMWGAGVGYWGDHNVNNIKVTFCTFTKMGRGCVDSGWAYTPGTVMEDVRNNEIGYCDMSDYCTLSHDGGAFYCWGWQNISGFHFHHNWLYNLISFRHPDSTSTTNLTDGILAGLYFDMGSGARQGETQVLVDHNTFWNQGRVNQLNNGTSNPMNWNITEITDFYSLPSYAYVNTSTLVSKDKTQIWNNTGGYDNQFYVTYQVAVADVFRNNVMGSQVNISWQGNGVGDVQNSLRAPNNAVPAFLGGDINILKGLYFRLPAGHPAINLGIVKAGVTDVHPIIGAPDAGAYEFGGTNWVPGYVPVAPSIPTDPGDPLPILIQAENYNGISAPLGYVSPSGGFVGGFQAGNWLRYDVNFAQAKAKVNMRYAAGGGPWTIQVRLGSPSGTLLGTLSLVNAGWNVFQIASVSLSPAISGVQSIYMVFSGDGDIDYFQFVTS